MNVYEPRRCGLLGKIPACGDFVRQHLGSPISSELERWLSAGSQSLYLGKHELGADCIRFVISAAECDEVAIGSLVKSVDRVGRSFPLVIFTSLASADAMQQLAALPALYAPFFRAAEAALREAASLEPDVLRDRVASLYGVQVAAETKPQDPNALAAIRGALAGQPEGAEHYALLTLCTATSVVQLGPASGPPTVLDCPLTAELGPSLWLTLTAARLRWSRGALSLLWGSTESRLLLALGYASDQLLAFSASPAHPSTRLWPLTTERPEAIARARALLEPKLGDWSQASVSELAGQLAHVRC